jgi:hypothetical protein
VWDGPLALDLHLEELLDPLVHRGVHRSFATLLCLLPSTIPVVDDEVAVAITAVGIGESVASGARRRLVPRLEQSVDVVFKKTVLVGREGLVVVRVPVTMRSFPPSGVVDFFHEPLIYRLSAAITLIPRIRWHDEPWGFE